MPDNEQILEGHSDLEKGAYLGAIASIATADRQASEEELQYIEALCDAANISPAQKEAVLKSATELSGEELNRCLDILKTSDLKYSLVTDMMAFANSDDNYSSEEKQSVQHVADYLQINQQQFSLLKDFTNKTAAANVTPEEVKKPDFLSSLGLKDKFQNAGINQSGLLKGLLGIAGPIILAKMVSGGLSRRRGLGGGFNSGRGGLGGNILSGGMGGGFGSIISMINGGRSFGNSGGILSKILGRGF
jgi:uncharacterized tellurite resistance protein B-like protein